MNRPRVHRSRNRVCVPELGLKQQATGSIEATGILDAGCMTAQLRVGANGGRASMHSGSGKHQAQLREGEGGLCH